MIISDICARVNFYLAPKLGFGIVKTRTLASHVRWSWDISFNEIWARKIEQDKVRLQKEFTEAASLIREKKLGLVLIGDMHVDAMRVYKQLALSHSVFTLDSMAMHKDVLAISGKRFGSLDVPMPTFIQERAERRLPGQSPRQDPYDLCDCESGKRYRKCCGRGRR